MKRFILPLLLLAVFAGGAFATSKKPAPAAPQRIVISVTSNGFEPADIGVQAGRPVLLTVTRTTDRTCATEILFKDPNVRKSLPLNQPVAIRFTPKQAGTLHYACGMGMLAGTITVR
jgi:plastocyanin domain-containing protein